LPTSLTYIMLDNRGFKPWGPDAEIGTALTWMLGLSAVAL